MSFSGYSEYAVCSVEWLEQTPSHWASVPMKYLALQPDSVFIDGDWIESKDLADSGIRYLTTGNVGEGRYREQGLGFISEDKFSELNCTEVFPGDMLVSRLNRPIGRACVVPELGFRIVTAVDNVVVRADPQFSRSFLVYLFSSSAYFRHTENLARGATMQRISRGLLGNIRLMIPPREEQTQIAKFLDYETARIDALIEKQQQLIALLKEKRQAVISHAVTKGLNPDAPMRDSGVEWLGEVPAHWTVTQIRYVTSQCGGGTPSKDQAKFWNGDIPWVSPKDMKVDYISDSQDRVTEEAVKSSSTNLIPVGSVLIVVRGMILDHSVPTALTTKLVTINQDMKALTPNSELDAEFLLMFLKGLKDYLLSHTDSSAHGTKCMNSDMLARTLIGLPPRNEQRELVKGLKVRLGQLDRLAESAESMQATLQERRIALISAAVTGKLDVRNWQAPEAHAQAEVA